MTPEDRIKDIARICYQTSVEAVSIIEFLEAGNTVEAEAALDMQTAPIANVIRKAMFERLVMAVMRMHDKPASDRETLPRAFDLLRDQAVFQHLATRLRLALTRWAALANDPRLTVIRNVRDFDVAHIIPSRNSLPRPRREAASTPFPSRPPRNGGHIEHKHIGLALSRQHKPNLDRKVWLRSAPRHSGHRSAFSIAALTGANVCRCCSCWPK